MKFINLIKSLMLFILCFLFMLIFLFYFIYEENTPPQVDGGCFENLFFQVKGEQRTETIGCFFNNCEGEDIYYLFLPTYADSQNLNVQFAIAYSIELELDDVKTIIDSSNHSCNLLPNTTYEILFLSKQNETLESGKLKVLQSQNLPTMYIETDSGSLDYLNQDKGHKEGGQLTLYSEHGGLEYCDTLDQIKGRGNETWSWDKRSYGIELDEETTLCGMGAAKKWVLLPNVGDDTYIRNKISYDMALAAGLSESPESCFVDLYVNNIYHGLYQLCEKVEIQKERIDISNLEEKNKQLNVNEYTNGELKQQFTENMKYVSLSCNPEDISGGYLIERDYGSKYLHELIGFQTSVLQDFYTVKSPEHASYEEVNYICNLFTEMEYSVTSNDGKNPFTGKKYTDYLDIDSFAFKYLIEEISLNNGGGASSAFYYKPEDAISNKIYAGPVWDYDKAYGSLKNSYNCNTRALGYLTLNRSNTDLYRYLCQLPEFRQTVCQKYQNFFSNYLDYLINYKIDEYVTEIQSAATMDQLRWKGANVRFYEEYDTFQENIEFLKKFISERKAFLDEIWIKNIEICTVHFVYSEPGYEIINLYLAVPKGESLQEIPLCSNDYSGNAFQEWVYEDTGEEFNPNQPLTQDITVLAQYR